MPHVGRARAVAAVGVALVALTSLVLPPYAAALDISCSDSGPGGSWTTVGRTPASSRVQDQEHDIKAPLLPLWTFDPRRWSHVSGQQFVGQPLVDDGCAYVASHRGTSGPGWVYALNTGYGEAVWQRQLEGGVRSSLALAGDLVLAAVQGTSGPTVVALDRRTGATRWRTVVSRSPGAKALASPVVLGRTVWVGVAGPRGASVLLDLTSGRLLRSAATASIPSAAAIDVATSRAFVPTALGVVAIDLDRAHRSFGAVVARGPGVATAATPNLIAGRRVVAYGDDGVVRVLRADGLAEVSSVRVGVPGPSTSTAASGTTVFGTARTPGCAWAVDVTTGTLRWVAPTGGTGPVSLANGVVYATGRLGDLIAIDAGTGLVVWRVPMAAGSETYGARTLSSAGVTIAEHLVLTASGQPDAADQSGFVVAYGPARLPV